ncbi:MAG: hypothetical protein AABZ31_00035 [Bdellovibrionota bacterium]
MGITFIILAAALIIIGFVTYLFLMIFYPEWVGITSKAEREELRKKYESYNSEVESDKKTD